MYRIQEDIIDTFIEKKSEFITYLRRTESEEEAKAFIDEIKKMHPKATHHCQAFLIDESIQRSNDDGEPSGTAGIPMLEILRKRNMEKITAVVVRYFGGVLLGAGGLIRAYSKGVADALSNNDIYEVKEMNKYTITVDYKYADQLDYLLTDKTVLDRIYDMKVSFVYIDEDNSLLPKIQELTSGSADIIEHDVIEIEVKVNKEELDA